MAKSFHRIRTVTTKSGATAVQVVWYERYKTHIAKHIGSAKDADTLAILLSTAQQYIADNDRQLSLFDERPSQLVAFDQIEATHISHRFARSVLRALADQYGLGNLDALYLDLAIMRIIEPCSKLRSIQLIQRYFGICYTRYIYERLPQLLEKRSMIEAAAIQTAQRFNPTFSLLLYDVTTLYFETHKPDDDLQARGFSKDDKSKQPQIVIGLLITQQGFPLIHEVFKGNTFEGHTMLSIIDHFRNQYAAEKPIIVADAAMLSQANRESLSQAGYCYIVGARLSNMKPSVLQIIEETLSKKDNATIRITHADYDLVCSYSQARYKKDLNELQKQIKKATTLIARQEPGRRAKFVKKSSATNKTYVFDETLKQKTELLLGIKGYCTNIPESILSNEQIILHYHDLWRIEYAFRMSKNDLKARPIFHHSHDAIRAHMLICFMALMISKFIEIKTGIPLRQIRDLLWQVHEIQLYDPQTKNKRTVRTSMTLELQKILDSLQVKITH